MSFGVFQLRRGTAAAWTSANPVLADGEMAIETDTAKFKIGNGVTAWNSLAYGGIVGPQGIQGNAGSTGAQGDKGWSPILASVTDGARRVLQIVDWTGGAGTKPSTTNQFIGPTGIVGTAAAAVDIRGAQGATGAAGGLTDGDKGDVTVSGGGATILFTGSLKTAGAVGNGTADDRAAFVSLDGSLPANVGITVAARHRIGSALTITRPLDFASGGRLVVPTGVTVTINAPIKAGIEHIFELEGTAQVVLSVAYNVERYAEWWGATVGADCSPAFAQCIKPGSKTMLQARDYVTSATMMIPAAATAEGSGYNWEGDGTATRVLLASASVSPIVQLGSTATPTDLNSAPADAACFDIYFTRNQAPNAGTVGVLIGWSRFARVERVRANTNITAFRITNAVSPFITDTFAKRDIAIAAGQGTDRFVGYHIDGTGALPAAGGNASVWMTRPQTELNVAIADSTGYLINGRFTDVFISQPETLGTNYGIDVQGDKGGAGQNAGSNANLVIENPVVDQTKTIGIRVRDVNQWGAVQFLQPYCGPATGDGMTVSNCDGHVGITTGQMRMNVSTAGKGITFDGCRSPSVQGTHIAECSTQALVLNNVTGGQFQPVIQNVTAQLSAAVQSVGGVTKSTIRPSINGAAGKVTFGLQSLASTNVNNFVSMAAAATGVVVTERSLAVGAEVGTVYPDALAGPKIDLLQEYVMDQPPSPPSGVTLFARFKARRLPTLVGPSGVDQALQPAFFSNRIGLVQAVPFTNLTTATGQAIVTPAPVLAAAPFAATNFFTRVGRTRMSTAATLNTGAGIRTSAATYFLSSLANSGGFFFVCRFGVAVSQAGSRGFVGLSTTTTQLPLAADPMGVVNSIGFAWGSADTTMRVMTNGAAANTANHVALGASFPVKTSAVDFYEVRLFAPSGSAASVNWSVQRMNTGDFQQGTLVAGLPVADTPMVAHCGVGTSAAAIVSADFQLMYIETDN